MAKIQYILILSLVLFTQVNAGHCADETNNFIVTNFEIAESISFPGQAMATVSGYFESRQYVSYVLFDYSLDGSNWIRSQVMSNQEFDKDYITHFTFNLAIDEDVSVHSSGVVSVVEDSNTVWCDILKISSSYSKRVMIS